ncbi:MAG: hypothetical protein ACLVJO_04325 [[Clostridium] scindens]
MTGKLLDPRKEFGKAVYDVACDNPDVVVFRGQRKSSGFGQFMEEFPERYLSAGLWSKAS